jgi:putative membrane protein
MMGNFYNMGWGGGFGFGWIFMLLFWSLIIWAIIVLAKNLSGDSTCYGSHQGRKDELDDKAMNILKERYAKGEISKEEFDKIRKDLE